MLVTIGLMIGGYIIVRMLSFLTRSGERAECGLVKVFAALALLFTLIGCVDLLISGSSVTSGLSGF